MKTNNFFSLLKYEFLNTISGFFTPFFGILFPAVMGFILTTVIPMDVPKEAAKEVTTSIILLISSIIPLSIMLVSFSATYAQEVEQKITFRLQLFQVSTKKLLLLKIIVNYTIMTFSLILYAVSMVLYNKENFIMPNGWSLIIFIGALYVIATIYFVLSFSIANIFKKFGLTYGVTMFLFFGTMLLSGTMGVQVSQMPEVMAAIAKWIPTSHFGDFPNYWANGFSGYNFAPFIQSLIFWAALAGITFFASSYKKQGA